MFNQQQIGIRQFFILVFLFTIGTSIIVGPHLATMTSYQDGWISALLGIIMGTSLIWVYTSFGKYFLDKSLIELNRLILGKWIGAILSLFFIVYLIVLSSLILINISHFISSRILLHTPIIPISYMFIALVVFGNILGIEVLARTAEMLLPSFLFLFIIFTLGLLPDIDVDKMKPFLEHGIYSIWESSVGFTIFVFGELVVFLMLTPYVTKRKEKFPKIKRYFISGAVLGGGIILVVVLLAILVLGPEKAVWTTYPTYDLAKNIDFAGALQRMEVIMAGIWFISIFIKLSVLMHVITTSVKQLFGLRDSSIVAIPIGMFLVPLSLWLAPNVGVYFTLVTQWLGLYTLVIMLLPIVIMVIGKIRLRFCKTTYVERIKRV
jgi:spore germination protein KB